MGPVGAEKVLSSSGGFHSRGDLTVKVMARKDLHRPEGLQRVEVFVGFPSERNRRHRLAWAASRYLLLLDWSPKKFLQRPPMPRVYNSYCTTEEEQERNIVSGIES